jgi:hypothetical protein
MLVKALIKYQDRDTGKVYDVDDLRDVDAQRGAELIQKGFVAGYTPKKNEAKPKGKGKK